MRMIRFLRLLLLVWAFVVVPTLCPAGVLVHACPEEEATTTACAHEDDCDADPCLQASTLSERPAPKNLIAIALVATPVVITVLATKSPTDETADAQRSRIPGPNAAPFPPGAQPLLI
jgi:hypothetical protein